MKSVISFWLKALPFTLGVALSLISFCFLIQFYDRGLYFDEEYIWFFMIFFLIGFPTLIHGIDKLSKPDIGGS
ncbi:MAG: hypothetical protein HWE26_09720 [Alteromonadaceae bacterium]|nr:hypothetical protein [Alteromonadaceae bacterium]